jgi:hypothetical protein
MQNAVIQRPSRGRLARTLCDIMGVLLGLLFLLASLCLLYGTAHYITSGGHINSGIGCALGVVTLLFLSTCLSLPTKLYENERLRIAGQLAASMTSAVTVASAVLPLVALLLLCVIDPPSRGSPAYDGGGVLIIVSAVIGLAAFLIFLPCTYILARKATMRLAHLAIGTVVAGVVGGLLGYHCY